MEARSASDTKAANLISLTLGAFSSEWRERQPCRALMEHLAECRRHGQQAESRLPWRCQLLPRACAEGGGGRKLGPARSTLTPHAADLVRRLDAAFMNEPYTHYRVAEKPPETWCPACQQHLDDRSRVGIDPSTRRVKEVTCGLCLHSEA